MIILVIILYNDNSIVILYVPYNEHNDNSSHNIIHDNSIIILYVPYNDHNNDNSTHNIYHI